jgi:hypothetical protein
MAERRGNVTFHSLLDAQNWARKLNLPFNGKAGGDLTGYLFNLVIGNEKVTPAKIKLAANGGLEDSGAGALQVDTDDSTIEKAAGGIRVKDGGITAAKLSTAVVALLPKTIDDGSHTVQTTGTGAPTFGFEVQVYDANGAAVSGVFMIEVWVSLTSKGAPGGVQTVNAPTSGTIQQTVTANVKYVYSTNSSGFLAASLTAAAGEVRYVMASLGGGDPVLASSSLTFS